MATSVRRLARETFCGLIVAYLRDGSVSDASFSLDTTASSKYPFLRDGPLFCFLLDGELWQITMTEQGLKPLTPGVTIEFIDDIPNSSKAMPQVWNLQLRIRVRMPPNLDGQSTSQEIAQKIDEALYRSGGKILIKDYRTTPPTNTGHSIVWNMKPRGEWKQITPTDLSYARNPDLAKPYPAVSDLTLEMELQYSTPGL